MSLWPGYPTYRNSGVEWLGDIPAEWHLWKLGHAYPAIGSGTTPPSDSEDWYGGDVPWITTGELREREILHTTKTVTREALAKFSALRLFPKGSIAIAMYGATIGRLGILGVEATTNQACCVLPNSQVIDNGYLYYWFQAVRDDIINLASGGGQPNISQAVVSSLRVSVPAHVEEQIQIARFLDYETARINALIEKQQQLIALLKEKRQAVISHAVTKGLNPNAPLRDSGVEWLGMVPAHWVSTYMKRHAQVIDCKHVTAEFIDEGIPVASIGEVKGWEVDLAMAKKTTGHFYELLIGGDRQPRPGDILFTRNATVGEAALVPEGMPKFAMGQDVCLIRFQHTAKTEFVLRCLKAQFVASQLELAMIGSTFKRVNVEEIRNLAITLPPREEQEAIVTDLERRLPKHDKLIESAEAAVTLLQERRTALISAAVTGKIDVRNWTPPESKPERDVA